MKTVIIFICLFASVSLFAQSELKSTVFGDVRFRHEAISAKGSAGPDNYDHLRLRARLGVKAQVSDQISGEIRLASGNGGTSTNQTFSGTRNYDFKLDRGYIKYIPQDNMLVRAGRTDNPFIAVGDNSLLFDADLNFDGASLNYGFKTETWEYNVILGHTIMAESSATAAYDGKMESVELAIRYSGENQGTLITLANHSFVNLKDHGVLTGSSLGNSNYGATPLYSYNYDVTSVGAEYTYKASWPVSLFAEYANNNRTSKNDQAVLYGLKINKVKKKGDWMLVIDNREVEKDSTIGALSDGDSFGGGTNGRSLNTTISYGLEDNANFTLTYMSGEVQIASGENSLERNRWQADINIKF